MAHEASILISVAWETLLVRTGFEFVGGEEQSMSEEVSLVGNWCWRIGMDLWCNKTANSQLRREE